MLVENGGFGAQAAAPIARERARLLPARAEAGRRARRRQGRADATSPTTSPTDGETRRIARHASGQLLTRRIDSFLLAAALAIAGVGLITLFSASDQSVARVTSQALSLGFALVLMWIVANIPPQTLARAAVPLYVVGVAAAGRRRRRSASVVNGSRRWLNLGVARFQPSELMKIALPLMLAWYFQKLEGRIGWQRLRARRGADRRCRSYLIKRQPDLGTALLIGASGFYVLYLAGLSWKVIVGLVGARRAPPRRSSGRICTTTSASAS